MEDHAFFPRVNYQFRSLSSPGWNKLRNGFLLAFQSPPPEVSTAIEASLFAFPVKTLAGFWREGLFFDGKIFPWELLRVEDTFLLDRG